MGMFPGSSTVEHSAVNRRVASSNLARGANLFVINRLTGDQKAFLPNVCKPQFLIVANFFIVNELLFG